jgi:hypothetical protein
MTPLEQRMTPLEQQMQELDRQVASRPPPAEFTPYKGALFKRGVGDEYDVCLYCPRCRYPAGPIPGGLFRCGRCRITLDVGGADLGSIILNHVRHVGKHRSITRNKSPLFPE